MMAKHRDNIERLIELSPLSARHLAQAIKRLGYINALWFWQDDTIADQYNDAAWINWARANIRGHWNSLAIEQPTQ
jgi:hypothetical protein